MQYKVMPKHREYIIPTTSCIGGWYIPSGICDGLINLFKENKQAQKPGVVGFTSKINKEVKDSIDIGIDPNWDEPRFVKYKNVLKQCVGLYEEKYPEVKEFERYGMVEGGNLQYYPPGGGYFTKHCERTSRHENRCLVWMTYLNDVPNGGTHFKYQNATTPAEKGLTLIWPTDFTHTHSGQISKTHEKYIITGWFGYQL